MANEKKSFDDSYISRKDQTASMGSDESIEELIDDVESIEEIITETMHEEENAIENQSPTSNIPTMAKEKKSFDDSYISRVDQTASMESDESIQEFTDAMHEEENTSENQSPTRNIPTMANGEKSR